MTLYSPEFHDKSIRKVFEKTEDVCRQIKPFTSKFSTVRSHLGYVDISVQKTREWIKLHTSIVNKLNPLREDHLRAKYLEAEQIKQYSRKQQKYIYEYGYSEVFDAFAPHLTLSRLCDESHAEQVASKLNFSIHEFYVDTVAAFEMGEHGTCNKVIEKFSLGDLNK